MSAVVPWKELPKVTIFVTRHWRTHGIYAREAAPLSSGYYTDESNGGVNWTPYTLGVDCFLTVREAWSRVYQSMHDVLAALEKTRQQIINAGGKAQEQYLQFKEA